VCRDVDGGGGGGRGVDESCPGGTVQEATKVSIIDILNEKIVFVLKYCKSLKQKTSNK
jgi:hypothetical protein